MKNKITVKTQPDEMQNLLTLAIEKGVTVETLERLLAMRNELRTEKAKEAYNQAMATFQGSLGTIKKTKEVKTSNGQVAYRYAPIESIVEQVKQELQDNGFSYSTDMQLLPDGVKVTVKVTHTAGHSESTTMQVPLGNKTQVMSQSQVVAAAQTFAKRYAFCNAFGILTGDEDTDGAEIKTETISLTDAQIKLISNTKTQEELIRVCGQLKTKLGAKYYRQLMNAYADQKKELDKTTDDDIDIDAVDQGIEESII